MAESHPGSHGVGYGFAGTYRWHIGIWTRTSDGPGVER